MIDPIAPRSPRLSVPAVEPTTAGVIDHPEVVDHTGFPEQLRPAPMSKPMSMEAGSSTVGVEEEFFLTDPETGAPVAKNVEVAGTAEQAGINLYPELIRCQIEANTRVHSSSSHLLTELCELRRTIASCAEKNGARLLAVAVPPTVSDDIPITATPRNRRIVENYGRPAHEQQVCGCHVHIGVPDRDAAIRASNFLRPWLPLFLALTANSALYHGAETGYRSWRRILWGRWPSAGPPPYFDSAADYDAMVAMMLSHGIILDRKMVYWDVRPSVRYPTVEIRISDIPATAQETALLATLIRATVLTARTAPVQKRPPAKIFDELLRLAYWKAARDGIAGELVDPTNGRKIPGRIWLAELIARIRPALEELGDYRFVAETVDAVLARGNGATRQLRTYHTHHDIQDVIAELSDATLQGCG
ncbi:carboxylate-amine ligase [Nocardia paucivorans]|uniref:carboxylate-amine ligase n=1 Tax=Nocardia paucivorans TaxID=114259 RepID=UPI00278BD5F7|nr:glutamate--cysteine ligase [Nocardia paucivorans]